VVVGAGYIAAFVAPVWDGEVTTVLLSLLLVGASAREYLVAVGPQRRARLLSVGAAGGLSLVLAGGAAARLVLPDGDVSVPSLLAYEAMLCAITGALLVGLLRPFWDRANVTDLVVELGGARSGTLRAALSRALGDPSLEVGYWYADGHSFLDAEGRVVSLPDAASRRSVTLVEGDGAPAAVIVHDPAVLDDPGLVEGVASAAQLAASNARLQADVQARVGDIAASRRRLLEARDDERVRLERRLRDGAEYRLVELRETLRNAQQSAFGAATLERLAHAQDQLVQTLDELRRLAQGLHPRILAEEGLESALVSLSRGHPFSVELKIATARMPGPVETAAYFVCAEAMANVAKHASASRVAVSVTADGAAVTVVVEDDGVGGADPVRGTGLRGITDRIRVLGGTFSVESAPGRGTRLAAEIPLGGEAS
jgi:signal transduction histidine kinase